MGDPQCPLTSVQIKQLAEFKLKTVENNESWDTLVDTASKAVNNVSGRQFTQCTLHHLQLEPEQDDVPAADVQAPKQCSHYKFNNPSIANFCVKCATKFEPDQITPVCLHCSHPMQLDDKCCSQCGTATPMPKALHHSPEEYHQLMATKLITEMSQSIAKAMTQMLHILMMVIPMYWLRLLLTRLHLLMECILLRMLILQCMLLVRICLPMMMILTLIMMLNCWPL